MESEIIISPSGEEDVAVKVNVTSDKYLVLKEITEIDEQYTLSFYVKTSQVSKISANFGTDSLLFATNTDWTRIVYSFKNDLYNATKTEATVALSPSFFTHGYETSGTGNIITITDSYNKQYKGDTLDNHIDVSSLKLYDRVFKFTCSSGSLYVNEWLEDGTFVKQTIIDSGNTVTLSDNTDYVTLSWTWYNTSSTISYTYNTATVADSTKLSLGLTANVTYWIYNAKLEKGNKPTDYTPAPEDTDQVITNLRTEYQQFSDKFLWIVEDGVTGDESSMTLSSNFFNLVNENINLEGKVTFNSFDDTMKQTINKINSLSNRNLVTNSNVENVVTDGSTYYYAYTLSEALTKGDTYTVSMNIDNPNLISDTLGICIGNVNAPICSTSVSLSNSSENQTLVSTFIFDYNADEMYTVEEKSVSVSQSLFTHGYGTTSAGQVTARSDTNYGDMMNNHIDVSNLSLADRVFTFSYSSGGLYVNEWQSNGTFVGQTSVSSGGTVTLKSSTGYLTLTSTWFNNSSTFSYKYNELVVNTSYGDDSSFKKLCVFCNTNNTSDILDMKWIKLETGEEATEYSTDSADAIAQNIYIAGTTTIDGGKIDTLGLFAQDIVATGTITTPILKSADYKSSSGGLYSSTGMLVDLKNKKIETPYFALDSDGKVYATDGHFTGEVTATDGTFTGDIYASFGTIGGFTIGSSALYNGTSSNTSTTAGVYVGIDGIRQYASSSAYVDIKNGILTAYGGTFRGNVYAYNGSFSGTIYASSGGTIAGFNITSSAIYSGTSSNTSTTVGVYLGTDGIRQYNSSSAYVDIKNGVLTARGVDVGGSIRASTGSIGAFTINSSAIYSGSSYLGGSGIYVGSNGISCGSTFQVTSGGTLTATNGTIAGFTIGGSAIYNGGSSLGGSGVYLGTNGISCGSAFQVTSGGALTATSGTIAGFNIVNNAIYKGTSSTTSTDAGIYIGTDGIRQFGSSGYYFVLINGRTELHGAIMHDVTMSGVTIEDATIGIRKVLGGFDVDGGGINAMSASSHFHSISIGGRPAEGNQVLSPDGVYNWLCTSNGNFIPREYTTETPKNIGNSTGYVNNLYYRTLTQSSDRRKKHDIQYMNYNEATDIILNAKPCSFMYNDDSHNLKQYGLIAQDVRDSMISNGKNIDGILSISKPNGEDEIYITDLYADESTVSYGINYIEYIAPLIKTAQYTLELVSTLQNELNELRFKLAESNNELTKIKSL